MSKAGSRGATFWSSESFPSSTSWSTTAAVAVFDTDARAKAVPVVMGSAAATSRMPEAPSHRRPSSQRIATDTPGIWSFFAELVEARLERLGRDGVRGHGRRARRTGSAPAWPTGWAWRTESGRGRREAAGVGLAAGAAVGGPEGGGAVIDADGPIGADGLAAATPPPDPERAGDDASDGDHARERHHHERADARRRAREPGQACRRASVWDAGPARRVRRP